MVLKISLCVLALLAAVTNAIKISDCGSTEGKVSNVTLVPPCPGDVCILPSGTSVTLKLGFQSNENTKKVTAQVHGVIGGVPLPFPLPNPDACQGSGLTCPLQSNTAYIYTNLLQVKKEYPRISVDIKWELVDENGKDLVCVLFPAKIQ